MSHNAVIAYVPALHKGYVEFFKTYPGTLYLLGSDFMSKMPRMERDIRAMDPELMKQIIESMGIYHTVTVISEKNKDELLEEVDTIIMPDEDASRAFGKTYLSGKEVRYVPTFLRWDKQISTKEFEVPADRVISEKERDKEILGKATKEAEKSPDWWRQVGAIITKEGSPLLVGHNAPLVGGVYAFGSMGDPRSNFDAGERIDLSLVLHAEAGLIAEAAREGIPLKGSSLYVTTFPCPTCAKSIARAGITRVYYAKGYSLLDAEQVLKAANVEIVLVKP